FEFEFEFEMGATVLGRSGGNGRKEKPRGLAPIGVIVLLAAIQLLKSAPCIESLIACCIPSA
ncbi:hypothetical protein, partial [Vibrio parahaemolyticus]